jgi:hypothetical protein
VEFILPKHALQTYLRVDSVKAVIDYIHRLDIQRAWVVKIEEKKPKRSENQNRFLWGVVYREICKHLEGWDAEDVHEYMLGEWSGWETLEGMGRKRIRPIRRSSKLNKQEFADFVSFIQRKAAEHGIFIPDPEL